jgi:hypothetical protein
MNKLNSPSISVKPSSPPTSGLELASWLIVIVPSIEAELTGATQRICQLAHGGSRRVRFIGLYENTAQELTLRRQMAGMAAIVSNEGIYTEVESVFGTDWAGIVRSRSQTGDLVACLAEHRIGRSNRSVSDLLQANIDLPFYILSSSYIRSESNFNWISQLLFWSVSIAALLGFFLLQVNIDRVTSGWTQTALILISTALELWMIWVWNNLFS